MKSIFTLIFLLVFVLPCIAQWEEVDHGINVFSFYDIKPITSEIAIVVGSNGTIAKTIDGGETWQLKTSGTTNDLKRIEFPTSNVGYIIGWGNTLLKTIDGGENWANIITGYDLEFYDLSCVNEDVIFISTSSGLIKSEDGGENWSELIPIPFYDNIQFINNNVGFVSRTSTWMNYEFENDLAKTIDGGETWQEIEVTSPFGFSNENIGFFYFEGLYKTTNGGDQFDLISYQWEPALSDIFVLNDNTIWGIYYWETLDYATPIRGILKSSDTGDYSNYMFPHIHGYYLEKIKFFDENTGYVVGRKYNGSSSIGLIWKNATGINGPMTAGTEEQETLKFVIYPNPTREEVNISLEKRLNENFIITINDLTGKQLFYQEFSDLQNIKIKTSQFPKGNYILSIKAKQKTTSKKIVIN